jgi:hypothetical protein
MQITNTGGGSGALIFRALMYFGHSCISVPPVFRSLMYFGPSCISVPIIRGAHRMSAFLTNHGRLSHFHQGLLAGAAAAAAAAAAASSALSRT